MNEVDVSWEKYPEIKRHFGEEWLRAEYTKIHPIFRILNEPEYLSKLNEYLMDVKENKTLRDHLRNRDTQFWDTYYELEIAYFLRKFGFKPELNEKIIGHETDILLKEQNLVIEVTHYHIPHKIESASAQFKPKSKSQEIPIAVNKTHISEKYLESYFIRKKFQNLYPNIVCFCPDMVIDLDCDDLAIEVSHPNNIPKEVSALALWHSKRILCLYDNTSGKKLQWKSSRLRDFFHQK